MTHIEERCNYSLEQSPIRIKELSSNKNEERKSPVPYTSMNSFKVNLDMLIEEGIIETYLNWYREGHWWLEKELGSCSVGQLQNWLPSHTERSKFPKWIKNEAQQYIRKDAAGRTKAQGVLFDWKSEPFSRLILSCRNAKRDRRCN